MTTKCTVRRPPLLLIACSLLLSCVSPGPSAADIAADRDRWRAVRDTAADGAIDAQESPLLAELLVVWNQKLLHDEASIGKKADGRAIVADLLRVYGLPAVQLFLVPEMQSLAPELLRLVDIDSNGHLSEAEILAIDPRDPLFVAVAMQTAVRLLKHRK